MANLTKSQFAKLCGMKSNTLAIYIQRGKVIVDENDYINDKNEVNALFVGKRNGIVSHQTYSEIPTTKNNFVEENSDQPENVNRNKLSLGAIEREKKLADLAKIEVDTRISILKEEKLMGSSIPVDLVTEVVSSLCKSFVVDFKNGSEDIIRMLAKTKNYELSEVAEIRGKLSVIINDAIKKSLANSKRDMKIVIANYSETRGVGEHD